MIKIAVVGLGKMGLSHTAIINPHKDVNLVAVCDTSSMVLSAFKKYNSKINTYSNYSELLEKEKLDGIIIATPTKLHYNMVKQALLKGIHVFCEKPFAMNLEEGTELDELARSKGCVNQVGYHNHFIGTFQELKFLLEEGIIGELLHFSGEAYGPVIVKPKTGNWRASSSEGGGCLNDYASHVINLIQEIVGRPAQVKGTMLKKFYSKEVEDGVFSNLILDGGLSGTLSVNWSDETYRKMSTSLMVFGTEGKIICDATELKVYLKKESKKHNYPKGWTIKYVTDLTKKVDFYLRGEEYTSQLDYFIDSIINGTSGRTNTFEQALYTDKVIEMLKSDA